MKRIILSLVVITAVAVAAVGATRAYFSDRADVSGNTFATGTVKIGGSQGLPITVTNLTPGVPSIAFANVEYIGTINADMYLGVGGTTAPGDPKYIADHTIAKIVDGGSNIVFWDYVSKLSTNWTKIATNLSSGSWGYYTITFTLDADTPNEHQGISNTDTILKFYAVQTGYPAPTELPYQY